MIEFTNQMWKGVKNSKKNADVICRWSLVPLVSSGTTGGNFCPGFQSSGGRDPRSSRLVTNLSVAAGLPAKSGTCSGYKDQDK